MTDPRTTAPAVPERIAGLTLLARNLGWSWNRDARALFRAVDPTLWHLTRHNPIALLRRVEAGRLAACAADAEFLRRYDALMDAAAQQTATEGTWFAAVQPALSGHTIAYFCAEFGLHNSVPIYSGGLGILAGDHCKAASDLGVPLVGVGLLYTRGYFDQRLRLDGWQEDADETFDASFTPLERVLGPTRTPTIVTVQTAGRSVCVGAWRMMVGRVPVYLLDTDLEQNDPADRELSHRLYGGAHDLRMRQEWILGVGGVRVLRALDVKPAVWHANEGHAAFMLLERVRELVAQGLPFDDAVRQVRASSIFTTHTPAPAGHDAFSLNQVEACAGPAWEEMGVSRDTVLRLGRHPGRDHDHFHMAVLAIRLSRQVNGVARRHGEESRRLWAGLWPGRDDARVPIGHVTNGVHLATWMSHRMSEVLETHFGPDWTDRLDEPGSWDCVLSLDDAALWAAHTELKRTLLRAIREDARRRWADQWKEALHLVGAGTLLEERALTIGFARRFATYKRATLIFRDLDRLQRLLTNPWRPVQLIFSGKAHPADDPGKQMLQTVYALTREARFEGRIAFLEDYEMHLAHRLVQGVDLWLNLPRPPLEASGTSGMKAALNAVPQLSMLDGWWAEGYDGRNGWAIPASPDAADADAADAERLYRLLEDEVVPLFYTRTAGDVPVGWVEKMKHALRVAGQRFTARRMVQQYVTEHYVPAIKGQLPPDDPPTA
ncbi:MAG TPA: alpha-glucan family phosphorylase [Gemmatimonadales bacterium]|nr:alpha-glucan family phosphorylase [Gemmatimonadales bacterium]